MLVNAVIFILSLSFFAFFYFVSFRFSEKFFPQFRFTSETIRAEWCTRIISTCVAFVTAMISAIVLLQTRALNDPVHYTHPWVDRFFVILLAYYVNDLIVMLAHRGTPLCSHGALIHHIAAIYGLCCCLWGRVLSGYALLLLVQDLSTPFVNQRWFFKVMRETHKSLELQRASFADGAASPAYSAILSFSPRTEAINGILMWIVFGVVRSTSIFEYAVQVHRHRYAYFHALPPPYIAATFGTALILAGLDVYWFALMTRGVIRVAKRMVQTRTKEE
ncbi:putative TLC domain [Paratrimastix pyriformis]|uniref:TLC domain n=1 Tax=Paratrimastix pyriformis TaxID=342808 RepID=A0ABQ8UQ99_9EUKA|nr:putative TLC domain [Paratrimastix pyriformis]